MKSAASKIATLLLSVFLSLTAIAQGGTAKAKKYNGQKRTAEDRTEFITKKMTEKLTLTAEQQPKVKEIILKREKQRDADREKYKGNKEEMKKTAAARFKTTDEELKTVLTPEQYQTLVTWRKEVKEKYQKPKGPTSPKEKELIPEDIE